MRVLLCNYANAVQRVHLLHIEYVHIDACESKFPKAKEIISSTPLLTTPTLQPEWKLEEMPKMNLSFQRDFSPNMHLFIFSGDGD